MIFVYLFYDNFLTHTHIMFLLYLFIILIFVLIHTFFFKSMVAQLVINRIAVQKAHIKK